MHIIGLTGPSGSGKGVIGAIFESLGIPSIDTDKIYHSLLSPPSACVDELVEAFGKKIVSHTNGIDRKILADLVFSDQTGKRQQLLNAITHKYVIQETKQLLKHYRAAGKIAAVIDAPLLIEAHMDTDCDINICVLADRDIRLSRIMARDGLSEEAAQMRLNAQKPDEFYIQATDYVLYNNGSEELLRPKLLTILKEEGVLREA